jgi:Family of unknown function (DUF6009)
MERRAGLDSKSQKAMQPYEEHFEKSTAYLPESRLVFPRPVDGLPYIRERLIFDRNRRGKPMCGTWRVVGWSDLARGAVTRLRRVFFVQSSDAYAVGVPSEAVDPTKIQLGKMTPRIGGRE